jgi:hypothetical protein
MGREEERGRVRIAYLLEASSRLCFSSSWSSYLRNWLAHKTKFKTGLTVDIGHSEQS